MALSKSIEQLLTHIFQKYEQVHSVILYGSRAKGTHNKRSDLDLAIANSAIDRKTLGMLYFDLNNSDIPYLVDLQVFEQIKNPQLKEHILRVGKVIYSKNT